MHFIAVLNVAGGTFRTADVDAFVAMATATFAAAGHSMDCRTVDGRQLAEELKRAASDPVCDVLIAGGGDGTVSSAAGICFASGKPLAVLPGGTMNLFARSLAMPLDLHAAVGAIATGELTRVDIATANGRPFVHQYSIGMHSRLVRIRDGLGYSGRIGKIAASLRAVGEALRSPPRFDAVIRTRTRIETRRATAIAVSNNLLSEGHVPYAEQIEAGVLGVYVVRPMGPLKLARLLLDVMLGTWKRHPLVSESEVHQVSLSFPRRKHDARAVIDGELVPLPPEVRLQIHPRALRVVRPTATVSASPVAA